MKKETKEWLNIAKEDKEVAEMTWSNVIPAEAGIQTKYSFN